MNSAKAKTPNLGIVIAGLLLGILMASMDNTIVSTAMGNIVGELGGMDKFVWVTSAYLVAEMAGMPIFGKLSDMYGRKKFFIFGAIVFMAGSALCGTADTITQLAAYRAVQGIGGGALVPIAFAIMYDAVPLEMRGKLGGAFGAVFGLSSIFGPLLGAYITDHIAWQWVFYINMPLGLLALIMVVGFYRESVEHSKQPIDWLGAGTLLGAVISLMFALELGGKEYAWDSPVILGLFAAFVVLTGLFLLAERSAKEPIISFALFRKRLYAFSILCALFSGAAFIVASVYIPIFIQGVLGGSATNSGLVLLPMMVGSVITASMGGFLMVKFSYRSLMLPTLALLVLGIALVTTLTPDSTRLLVTLYMIMIGLGVGASFSVLSTAAIHGLAAQQRGSASATLNFLRSLGMTIGITTFGIIQSHYFSSKMAGMITGSGGSASAPALDIKDPHALLSQDTRALIPPDILSVITSGLSSSIVRTFAWAVIPAVLALLAASFMGRQKVDASAEEPAASGH
ncbi:Multidrug resistance protein 3 [Paenibacillus auburnensis]|uniref:Multidrug resistance protein 3 n=1 Tax=Paenibacillus auburnensis TaxID=2905649 RepID=A0ABM9BV16_9BACL|nr:MDR family MFS transporter [Paenibacillus auburnensis]CAH1194222.1 Multidrug resistance protein 3 [Paenibacillus auburnensis]